MTWTIDTNGKLIFNDERFLFSRYSLNVCVSHLWVGERSDLIDYTNLVYSAYDYEEDFFLNFNVPAYFYYGHINLFKFYYRKARPFYSMSNFAIFDVIKAKGNIGLFRPKASYTFRYDTILRDTFFENQEFVHSFSFEMVWVIFPTSIIISILIPSLYLLYSLDDDLDPVLTIKVIGHQWYWSYEFDNWVKLDEVYRISYKFDSNIIPTDMLEFGTKRLLEVDNRLVIPMNLPIRFLVTSGDVLHSWAVPELGIKVDAVPGRLNQVVAYVTCPGIFYGQCSELCGAAHGFMPIVVQAMSVDAYKNNYLFNPEIEF